MSWSESDALDKVIKMIINGSSTKFIAKELASDIEYHDHYNDWTDEIEKLNKFADEKEGENGN